MNYRIGIGYDVHRLVAGRPCKIGGVLFGYEKGLAGHSDADVLLHAICDALLGALNLGDLGGLFPDSDPKYKDADSKELIKHCYDLVKQKGYRLGNLDTVIICEGPKINKRKKEIQSTIAELLSASPNVISIKATTEEKMGFTGRGEGIKAWAYVLLMKQSS